ncbi:MAG: hypothetical protein ACJ8R9_12030 [Steroidobacteraceae bacterium]
MQAVIANMRVCGAVQDDARRLSCYDKQFRQSERSSGQPDSPTAPNALSAEERFGLNPELERKEHGTAGQPAQLDKLAGHVAAVSYKLRGEAVVTLDNGQVWEQAEVGARVPLKPGDEVRIRRAALGSFWLSTQALGFRVRRVR